MVSLIGSKTNETSDTLLRHSRIHKQGSDGVRSSNEPVSGGPPATTHQDDSPPTNLSAFSRTMSLTGPEATEQLTPASYSTQASLAQGHQEDVQILPSVALPPFSQNVSKYPMAAMHALQSGTYSATILNQFQPASNVLPSPPAVENDVAFVARNDSFSVRNPLEA